jgi:hypothetical protein
MLAAGRGGASGVAQHARADAALTAKPSMRLIWLRPRLSTRSFSMPASAPGVIAVICE